jgi:hypothetical protein
MGQIRNNRGGSGMAEMGPAFFVLIVVIMVPLCDLLGLACSYVAGYVLNNTMARECACKDPTNGKGSGVGFTNIKLAVTIADGAWKNNILAGLAQAKNATTIHAITYVNNNGLAYTTTKLTVTPAVAVSGGPDPAIPAATTALYVATCQVITQIPIQPLFVVPFIGDVPGLSAPITFVYACQRPQEEKGFQ